jgi:hypothetical protein
MNIIKNREVSTEETIRFASELKDSVGLWLEEMNHGLEPGRFRFCKKGSLVPEHGHQGQFVTCFAMRIAWFTGVWDAWPQPYRNACINFVSSFQQEDGRFVDKQMLGRTFLGSAYGLLRRGKYLELLQEVIPRSIRAETRQSATVLLMVNAKPTYTLPFADISHQFVMKYVRNLPWENPWAAGSHASHLIFFLYANGFYRNNPYNYRELIDTAFDELDRRRDQLTGTWGTGTIESRIRVNGAMKVLTAHMWTGRPLKYARELLDFALNSQFDENGCSFLNRLLVVHETSKHVDPGYRNSEIEELAFKYLDQTRKFMRSDGAFSYNIKRAQLRYDNAWVSLGGEQSDMHGTMMLTWASALCLDLLGLREQLGWHICRP